MSESYKLIFISAVIEMDIIFFWLSFVYPLVVGFFLESCFSSILMFHYN